VLDRFLKFCISCLCNIYASVAVQGIVPNVYLEEEMLPYQ
jgi:hypothetical protein